MLLEISADPIDSLRVLESVRTTSAGAAILFIGTVREFTHGRQTTKLNYEAYPAMALAECGRLVEDARARWSICEAAIAHRTGVLELGEISVAVAVSSPHRAEAFAAGQFLIDELKVRVPVWKQEHWADGTIEWIDPTVAAARGPEGRPPEPPERV